MSTGTGAHLTLAGWWYLAAALPRVPVPDRPVVLATVVVTFSVDDLLIHAVKLLLDL